MKVQVPIIPGSPARTIRVLSTGVSSSSAFAADVGAKFRN